tara:strand:- start:185 stop:634 length:450 start_codon:yes stop_codon:yes gene_type:complete
MPNKDVFVECDNCGGKAMWVNEVAGTVLVKVLPKGWTKVGNTYNGDVFFDRPSCEQVWTSTREYKAPLSPILLDQAEASQLKDAMTDDVSVRSQDREGMCACGVGPYSRKGMIGHMRSHVHRLRMAGEMIQPKPLKPSKRRGYKPKVKN